MTRLIPQQEPCRGCAYLSVYTDGWGVCSYFDIVGKLRPCPPGELCTVKKEPTKRWRNLARKVTWDTEKGKELFARGYSDAKAAKILGIKDYQYRDYRMKHWGGKNERAMLQMQRKDGDLSRELPEVSEFQPDNGEDPAGAAQGDNDRRSDSRDDPQHSGDEPPKAEREETRTMILDTGDRTPMGDTGFVRDCHEGKGRMDLLPWNAILEVAKHCEEGAIKYGERNIDKGAPLHSLLDSGARHLAKYIAGMDDEDHLRAACWNLLWALEQRTTHPELNDMPWRDKDGDIRP